MKCFKPIQVGGGAIICAQLPRLIQVLLSYKTDPKWFGNSSLAILCTLKRFLGTTTFLGSPGGPLEVEGPINEIFSKMENQLCLLFGHTYRM